MKFESFEYFSDIAKRAKTLSILLPPSYICENYVKYPVAYILHGFFENHEWMTRPEVGVIDILEELCGKGHPEMIVVSPSMFTSDTLDGCTGLDLQSSIAYDSFIHDFKKSVIPFINENFRVKEGRENTAITGFSMGGREALYISFSMPEYFGFVGACCPAPGLVKIEGSPLHPGQISPQEMKYPSDFTPYLLIAAANGDPAVGTSPKSYHDILCENGVNHTWRLYNGTGHDHTSVKPHLTEFFSNIFPKE